MKNKNIPFPLVVKSCNDLKAVRYNGYLLDVKQKRQIRRGKRYAFFMDFLIMNLKGIPIFEDVTKFNFEFSDYGTKTFENKVTINYEGKRFATMVFNPRSRVMPAELVQFQLENYLFYTMPLKELGELVKEVIGAMGLKYKGLNRLDLALDMAIQGEYVTNVLQALNLQYLRVSGRKKKIQYHYETQNGVQVLEGATIGKRSSGRMLRIYNKTKENEKTLKTYINDAYDKIGIDKSDVWRYEFQLGNAFLRKIEINFENLFDIDFLFNLFNEGNNNHFSLKHNTGKKETNKEKDFYLFDFYHVRKYLGYLKVGITRLKRNIKESFIGQQRIIKGLMRSYFSSGQNKDYLTPIDSIINDFRLWSWFEKKKLPYIKEFYKAGIFKTVDVDLLKMDLNVNIEL